MRRDVLAFLKQERDYLATELEHLQRGTRRVQHLNSGVDDITAEVAAETEARLLRFEELIAAVEARLT